jgi:hypothetical protein
MKNGLKEIAKETMSWGKANNSIYSATKGS